MCPVPPPPPPGGAVVNNPLIFPMEPVNTCVFVPGTVPSVSLQCHSFLQIYIQTAVGGRVQISAYSPICDIRKPLLSTCTNTSVATLFRNSCHGQVCRFLNHCIYTCRSWQSNIFKCNIFSKLIFILLL